jgi:hypothetical protein
MQLYSVEEAAIILRSVQSRLRARRCDPSYLLEEVGYESMRAETSHPWPAWAEVTALARGQRQPLAPRLRLSPLAA